MSDYDKKEPKDDEGIELPAGCSDLDEVLANAFSPMSKESIETLLEDLKNT